MTLSCIGHFWYVLFLLSRMVLCG